MQETSPYEGGGGKDYQLNGRVCLGRIVSVDALRRRCRVKTIGLPGVTDDLDLQNVRIFSMASHGEGDESAYIPRVNCLVVVTFINTEPYIIGYWQSIANDQDTPPDEKEKLREGDYIFKTRAGNRLILRSGGSIEAESTKMCRVWLLPSRNLINALMQNLELYTDGGQLTWTHEDNTDDTKMKWVLFDSITGANIVDIQAGKNDDGSVFSIDIGPRASKSLVPSEKKFHLDVKPDGTTTVSVNNKATLIIDPGGNITLTHEGNLTTNTKGNFSATVTGNANVKAAQAVVEAKKLTLQVDGNQVPGNLVTDHPLNQDPITGVLLMGHPNIPVP